MFVRVIVDVDVVGKEGGGVVLGVADGRGYSGRGHTRSLV